MSIKTRIFIAAFGCLILTSIIACLGALDMNRYGVLVGRHDLDYENVYFAERMSSLADRAISDSRGIYTARSLVEARPFYEDMEDVLVQLQVLSNRWRVLGDASNPNALASVEADAKSFIQFREHLDALARTSLKAADSFGNVVDATPSNTLEADLDHFDANLQVRLGNEDRKLDQFKTRGEHQLLIAGIIGAGLLMAFVIWQLLTKVTRPLYAASKAIVELAEGHLDIALPVANGKDEISVLWGAIGILKYRAIEARKLARQALREAQRREAEARQILLD